MSMKKKLADIATEARKKLKELEGHHHGASEEWLSVVDEYCEKVNEAASLGEDKHFFDMQDYNQATITRVSIGMKEKLGDVLVMVSPRGIEARWEMSE